MTYIEREALLEVLSEHRGDLLRVYAKITEENDKRCCRSELGGVVAAIRTVQQMSAADVAPVVYCKNCKEWKEFVFAGLPAGVGACKCNLMDTDAHFYCANGAKRED